MTIYLEHIDKSYHGSKVLSDFSLTVEDGRCYVITGPAGSGKTTVLKIFMELEQPDAGKVSRMGDYKYPTLQSAYVSQEGQLNGRKNAVWNVRKYHRTVTKGRAIEELSAFLPAEAMKTPVSGLTAVQRRYVKIVGALFVPADFIVLDDPFCGMTDTERKAALSYIMTKRGTRPLLLAAGSTEDLDFARIIQL